MVSGYSNYSISLDTSKSGIHEVEGVVSALMTLVSIEL